MRLILTLLFALPILAQAKPPRALTVGEYENGTADFGDVVFDPQTNLSYLTMKFSRHLSSHEDPTGTLAKTKQHAQFTKVDVQEVLAELTAKGKLKSELPIDIWAKVFWRARDNGPLGIDLDEHQLVHGRLSLTSDGGVQFEVLNIPNAVLAGIKPPNTFSPSLPVAQAFNGQIGVDDEHIEHDYRQWLGDLLQNLIPSSLSVLPRQP